MKGKDKLGFGDEYIHATIYDIDKSQGPTFSTGKSTQYSVIMYLGKESEKGYIYPFIYI